MQTLIVFASVFIATVYSICTGSKYWNPLNNACVNCNIIPMQSVLGNLQTFTMLTALPTNVFLLAPQLLHTTPMISPKLVMQVFFFLLSMPMESH